MKRKLIALLCACMVLGGCTDAGTGNASGQQSQEQEQTQTGGSGEVQQLGGHENQEIVPVELKNAYEKAAYFLDQVYAEIPANTLVSPLSLNIALGMATEGTSGETAKELYRYLGSEDYANWVDQYLTFAEGLEAHDEGWSKYSFQYQIANSIWVRQGDTMQKEFQDVVKKKFRAEAQNVDFMGDPTGTADKINNWCDVHTQGLIKEIVKPNMFSPELASILVNSVYFESPWGDKWGVNENQFTNLAGKTTTQEMLIDWSHIDAYYENEKCTAFEKSYYNGFKFIGILPKAEGEFTTEELDLASLMASRTQEYEVHAVMPKLNFDTSASKIVDILKAQGVLRVFDPEKAEFGRMLEDRQLFISDIIQKCKIELDEDGTKAAAVTAIMVKDSAAFIPDKKEVKEVYLTRPFAFLIYDSENDQILFIGKVTDLQ
ncbi:MAG: hypothetical protein II743_11325 [Lachnospiraceae bacterium]|nr:hypothetical protein [Lachnospiraceae bacterium]